AVQARAAATKRTDPRTGRAAGVDRRQVPGPPDTVGRDELRANGGAGRAGAGMKIDRARACARPPATHASPGPGRMRPGPTDYCTTRTPAVSSCSTARCA